MCPFLNLICYVITMRKSNFKLINNMNDNMYLHSYYILYLSVYVYRMPI